ncbi:hypothetical protein ACHAPT_009250 [Fusarium lateritium]
MANNSTAVIASFKSSSSAKPHADQHCTASKATPHPQNPSPSSKVSETSGLEKLRPELRRSILAMLDLDQLEALVKASPTFHQQYRHDRRYILTNALQTTLGVLTVDAHAVIRPLVESYAIWALTNVVSKRNRGETGAHIDPLSPTEELRIVRGFYRFQIWCNLFGSQRPVFSPFDVLDMFFGLYEPWEVQEVASVHTFAETKFDLKDIPQESNEELARERQLIVTCTLEMQSSP